MGVAEALGFELVPPPPTQGPTQSYQHREPGPFIQHSKLCPISKSPRWQRNPPWPWDLGQLTPWGLGPDVWERAWVCSPRSGSLLSRQQVLSECWLISWLLQPPEFIFFLNTIISLQTAQVYNFMTLRI